MRTSFTLIFSMLYCVCLCGPGTVAAGGGPGVELLGTLADGATKGPGYRQNIEVLGKIRLVYGIVDVFTRLNVRSGPGTGYPVVGKLQPGEKINIIRKKKDWYNIIWSGKSVWVCGYYVWTPGKGVRNPDIARSIRNSYGPVRLSSRSRAEWPGEQYSGAYTGTYSGGSGGYSGYSGGYSGGNGGYSGYSSGYSGLTGKNSELGYTGVTSYTGKRGRLAPDGGLAIPLYSQGRVGAKYPGGFCGPTALKMALEYCGVRKHVNYLGLTRMPDGSRVYHRGQGSGYDEMCKMARYCGLRGTTIHHGKSLRWLRQQTAAGHPVVVGLAGYYGTGRYTKGHIVCVAGVTPDGRVIINDPAGGGRHTVNGRKFLTAWSRRDNVAIVVKR